VSTVVTHRFLSPPCGRRQDDKTVREYGIDAGTVLHLVLALRGGRCE
jgi:hypothetical protein